MLVRTAFWVGKPKLGRKDELVSILSEELIPAMRKFPGVADIKLLWPNEFEDNPPEIFCQVFIEYASSDAMQEMLTCPERAALRPRVVEAVGMFEGSVSHINYAVA